MLTTFQLLPYNQSESLLTLNPYQEPKFMVVNQHPKTTF